MNESKVQQPGANSFKTTLARQFGQVPNISAAGLRIALRIIDRAGKNREFFESRSTTSRITGCKKQTIRNWCRRFEDLGILERLDGGEGGRGRTIRYRVHGVKALLDEFNRRQQGPEKGYLVWDPLSKQSSRIKGSPSGTHKGIPIESRTGPGSTPKGSLQQSKGDPLTVPRTLEPKEPLEPRAVTREAVPGATLDTSLEASTRAHVTPRSPFMNKLLRRMAEDDARLGGNLS